MTPTQKKFVQLDKKKAEYKEFVQEYTETIKQLVEEAGTGSHFQDEEGTVYQVEECDGKFMYFDKFEVKRTKRVDEQRGTLSVKKAQELGYNV